MSLILRRGGLPSPPVEIADEIELYARESGRHGTIQFIPTRTVGGRVVDGTWLVRFTLRPDDKRLSLYQEGKVEAEAVMENVWLHTPKPGGGYTPLVLGELGASGVRQFLDRGNMWGRGEFTSLEEQARKARESNETLRDRTRLSAKERSRHKAMDTRRSRLKIPFLPGGITKKATQGE